MITYLVIGVVIGFTEFFVYRKQTDEIFNGRIKYRFWFSIVTILMWPVALLSAVYDIIEGNGPFKRNNLNEE